MTEIFFFTNWLQNGDVQLMMDCLPTSFLGKINALLEQTQLSPAQIRVVSSAQSPITYPYIARLRKDKLSLQLLQINERDQALGNQPQGGFLHSQLVNRNIPLWLAIINQFFYSLDLRKVGQ